MDRREQHNIDDLFAESLGNSEPRLSDDIWARMEARLDAADAAKAALPVSAESVTPLGSAAPAEPVVRSLNINWKQYSMAAALVIALISGSVLFLNINKENNKPADISMNTSGSSTGNWGPETVKKPKAAAPLSPLKGDIIDKPESLGPKKAKDSKSQAAPVTKPAPARRRNVIPLGIPKDDVFGNTSVAMAPAKPRAKAGNQSQKNQRPGSKKLNNETAPEGQPEEPATPKVEYPALAANAAPANTDNDNYVIEVEFRPTTGIADASAATDSGAAGKGFWGKLKNLKERPAGSGSLKGELLAQLSRYTHRDKQQ
ncbi:MAG: hypothetical protein V4543_09375 [Bacteroidota bacterium]